MPDFAPTESVAGEPWTVNVADGDQRTLTIGEIVQLYKAGIIVEDSYCWRDGMGDWLPLAEIEILHGACTARSTIEPDLEAAIARPDPALGGGSLEDAPTASVSATQLTPAPTSVRPPPSAAAALFGDAPSPKPSPVAAAAAAPAAARRVGGRGTGGADLFGAVAKAGGDDDVMTSVPMSGGRNAPASSGSGHGGGGDLDEPKLTGQRNESSVLFSLSALTEKSPDAPSSAKQTEGSGLIDIRALAAPRSGPVDSGRNAKVDDIMNLGGGGAFSAALAAPVLAPPPVGVETSFDTAASSGGGKSNKALIFAILGAACILALAMVFVMKGSGDKDKTAANGNGTGATMPNGTALPDNGSGSTTPAPPADPAMAAANPAAPSSATTPGTGAPLAVAPTPGKAIPATGSGGHATASRGNNGAAPDTQDPTPAPAVAPAVKPTMNQALAQFGDPGGAGNASANSGGSTAPFDRGAAAAALGAVNVASCKKSDGPTGSGHVSITFGSNGQVQTAVVDSPPFEGTSVGGCVAGKFRAAHVPGFSGGAQRVGKSFTIN